MSFLLTVDVDENPVTLKLYEEDDKCSLAVELDDNNLAINSEFPNFSVDISDTRSH